MRRLDVCAATELPDGSARVVRDGSVAIGIYNLGGELYAIEDRCSHDDGPLADGELDVALGIATCPRHGARIDIRTGRPLTLPAVLPVATFSVEVVDGRVVVDLGP